jgi:hypothetical protein
MNWRCIGDVLEMYWRYDNLSVGVQKKENVVKRLKIAKEYWDLNDVRACSRSTK